MTVSRRHFLNTTLASVAALAGPFSVQSQAATKTDFGFDELHVLSDGNLVLPARLVLPAATDANDQSEFLQSNKLDMQTFEPDCNLALWKHKDRTVLFDVGAGSNFMPSAGKLPEDMESNGFDPADVTDVVFTHAHPDHLWGLVDDFDELAFPDANFYMHAAEWDYWRDENTFNTLPDERKSFAVGAKNRMAYIEERVRLFNYGDEVLPGIEAIDTHGHTPGHTSFAIHQGSEAVLILGDAITHPVISFARVAWPSGSDQDQAAGRATRLALLDRLVQDKMRILGYHLPHPGLGYAEKDGANFRYVAL